MMDNTVEDPNYVAYSPGPDGPIQAVEMIPKAKVAAKSKGEQSPQEKGEGDEGAKESEPDDPPITNLKELLLAMKPRFAPELKDSKIYIHTIKWYGIHWLRSLALSAILVLVLYAFAQIPFSTGEPEPGKTNYYNAYPVAIGFAAFTAFVYMVICYGFFVLLYGFVKTRALLFVALPALVWSVGNWFVFLSAGLEPWWWGLDLISYGVFAVLVVSTCLILNRVLKHKENFLVIFGVPILVHMIIIGAYAYFVMPFYRNIPETDNGAWFRFLFRLVIHPVINKVNAIVTEMFVPDFENTTAFLATGYALGIIVEGAFIGRLMTITIGEPSDTVLTAIALGALEIVLRATFSRKERIKNFLLPKIIFCKKEWPYDRDTERDLRAAYMHYSMTVENSSVFIITAMFAFFWPHRLVWNLAYSSKEPNYTNLLIIGAIQLVINFVVDYVSIIFEHTQHVETFRPIREEPFRMFIWELINFTQMILLIIYINRMLPFQGFCDPQHYLDPCHCSAGIDFDIFNTTCNGTFVDAFINLTK